jgi:acyl phosphate:glycerol-3-phosphate acyltransferase
MGFILILVSYLLGSIPTAYFASRLLKGEDIRHLGDSNMGAANAYRQLGAKIGITVGIVDAAKGALAVGLAERLGSPQVLVLACGLAAIIGHNWPVFLGLRGGRGMSTTIGVLLVTVTMPVIVMALPCLITLIWTRNVTKAAAVLFVPLSALGWWFGLSGLFIGYGLMLPCVVALAHFLQIRHIPANSNP